MMVFRGMGTDDAPDDLTADLAALDASIRQAFVPDPSASINVNVPSGLTLNAQGQIVQPQTFSQWVTANSTLLLVAFGAVGALVALTRAGR